MVPLQAAGAGDLHRLGPPAVTLNQLGNTRALQLCELSVIAGHSWASLNKNLMALNVNH
jgi:hypothetical protein